MADRYPTDTLQSMCLFSFCSTLAATVLDDDQGRTTHHSNMVEVVGEEDGAQLLCLEGAGQLHEQVHAGIPHAVQVVVQLPILH